MTNVIQNGRAAHPRLLISATTRANATYGTIYPMTEEKI
jgi:hypothetical protein